jgi:PAS domain S-box-containing protein
MLYMFDWKEMKRWGIQETRLPEGSIIINKELTFWKTFRWYIIGTVVFVIIETLLVVFLIVLYRKQKRVEKKLYEAAEEWRVTFDSIQDMIFMLDLDFKVIRANAPALAFLNLPVEKVLGRYCYTLMHETNEPPETCLVPSMTKTKRHEHTEFYDQKRKAWFHLSVAPILDDKGEIQSIVHQIRDITEQKQTAEEIQRARAELLRVERSFRINELTASLAHELNQPLAAILSNAQAALHFLESDKPDLKEFREILRDIVQDDKRAGNVIRSLRAMMKREEGEKNSIILNDVLKDVVAIFRSEAVLRHVAIEAQLAELLPPVLADRIQLQQVTLNLIMNAAEAMAQNSSEERKIILRTYTADTCVRVSVRDFGRGIDEEDLKRVFQPFFTKKGTGLGMGLAISKSIIEAHGGRIWGENHPDGGALFAFELPVMDNK